MCPHAESQNPARASAAREAFAEPAGVGGPWDQDTDLTLSNSPSASPSPAPSRESIETEALSHFLGILGLERSV